VAGEKTSLIGTLQTLGDISRQSEWIWFADLQGLFKIGKIITVSEKTDN